MHNFALAVYIAAGLLSFVCDFAYANVHSVRVRSQQIQSGKHLSVHTKNTIHLGESRQENYFMLKRAVHCALITFKQLFLQNASSRLKIINGTILYYIKGHITNKEKLIK